MKINRLKTSGWIAAFLIAFCTATLINTWYTRNQMYSLVKKAQSVKISDNSSEEDIARVKPLLDDIERTWKKYEPRIATYSRHDEVERVTEEIEWLEPLYDNGFYSQLNVKLVGIKEALEHLVETEKPSIANIL